MTFMEIDDAPADEGRAQIPVMIKCSWCGAIFPLENRDLGLAICRSCYDRMLADFLRQQQLINERPAGTR